jgi:hypothetical protein
MRIVLGLLMALNMTLFVSGPYNTSVSKSDALVREGVVALELVVNQGHLDEWIGNKYSVVIHEPLQISLQIDDDIRFLGWRIYGVACAVLEHGAGELAQARCVSLQFRLSLQHMIRRQEAAMSDEIEADRQRLPAAQDLFCGSVTEIFRQRIVLKQFIVRRENVFDFGAPGRIAAGPAAPWPRSARLALRATKSPAAICRTRLVVCREFELTRLTA